MSDPTTNCDTRFSLIDSLVDNIQSFGQVSEVSNKISKLASIAKFAIYKVDRLEKLYNNANRDLDRLEERHEDTQEEMRQLRRDNDGSVELKRANLVNIEEKNGIIQGLEEDLEESRGKNQAVEETKNTLVTKFTDQGLRILDLSLDVAEYKEMIKELQEENSRLIVARDAMERASSTPFNNSLKHDRAEEEEEEMNSHMPPTRRHKVVASVDRTCLLHLSSNFDRHALSAAKHQFFQVLNSYIPTSETISNPPAAIHFNEENSKRLTATIFNDLLSLGRLTAIQVLILEHNTSPTIPIVPQVLDTEQVALLGDHVLGPAMQSMSSSLEHIVGERTGLKNTSSRKMLYLLNHYLNFQKQFGLVQDLYRKDIGILERLRMGSGLALQAGASRWDITTTITDYLLSVTTASDENRVDISRVSRFLAEMVACWGKGILVLVSWDAVNTLENDAGISGLATICEILLQATGGHFERHCELLERHVWDPVIAGLPLSIDLSVVARPVIEMFEEIEKSERAR